jgi:hypothetical protein
MKFKRNQALFLTVSTVPLSNSSSVFVTGPESSGLDSLLSDPVLLTLVAIVAVSMIINICLLIWGLRMRRQIRHEAQYLYNQPVYNEDVIHDYAKMETPIEFKTEAFAQQQVAKHGAHFSMPEPEVEHEVGFSRQGAEAGFSMPEPEAEPDVDFSVQEPEAEPEEFTLEMIRQVLVDLQQVQETADEPVTSPRFEASGTMTLEPIAPEKPTAPELTMPELIPLETTSSDQTSVSPILIAPTSALPAPMPPVLIIVLTSILV